MSRKVKYDVSFKLKCVKEVQKKKHSVHLVSSRENFCKSLLRKWILDYGISGLEPKKNQVYSAQFKFNVIKEIRTNYLSLREARIKFKIPSESVIIKWQKDFTTFGLDGLNPKPKGRPKNMSTPKRKSIKSKESLSREEELLLENERLL